MPDLPVLNALNAGRPPTPGEPPSLPEVREDPAFIAAGEAKDTFVRAAQMARMDHSLTDLYRAVGVVKAYNTCVQRLGELRVDLDARRARRMTWITSTGLPLGPGIPTDASPADRVVLLSAFTAAFERQAGAEKRARVLADAQRFGDESTLRATLTAALDESDWRTFDRWASEHSPTSGALAREWRKLNRLIGGYTGEVEALFEQQMFTLIRPPEEVRTLPSLVQAANNQAEAFNRHRGPGVPLRPMITVDQLLA
ncbi:hypothetical protein [Actinoplanes solisilvae]|uniref:hypothetical protein n=1 Tax=Actinoplanes solisilvae TaxID=2486853 RepID=UPI000FD7888F|nr:hypothetical protein [Actinoplanes solisilvae]